MALLRWRCAGRGLAEVEVCGTWRRYSLPAEPSPELAANLFYLQDCNFENPLFKEDLRKVKTIRRKLCGPESR